MIVLFWILTGLLAYAYVGYPVLILLLGRVGRRRWVIDESHQPLVSFVIPAYNEEGVIAGKLDNTLALDYPAVSREILVASESDDGTDALVERYAARGVRLISSAVRLGKVANQHRAVEQGSGEILVFTDANAMLRRDALRKLVRRFADPRVGAVSGRLAYRVTTGIAGAYNEDLYWDFEMILKRASSHLGSLPGANGSLYAVRRSLYRPLSETRGDDFELPIRVILQGHASILEPEAVSEEAPASGYRDQFLRKVRIVNWMVVSALVLLKEAIAERRWLLAWQLLSHKLNRWAVPFWLLALAPVSVWLAPRGGAYLAAALLQGVIYTLAVAGLAMDRSGVRLPSVVSIPFYFVLVNAAALVAIAARAAGREARWHKRADGLS
ncbi:MAG: glycosyltransferase family 2 protein [Candidatus Polarisedimenticolia bacterium]